MNATQSNPIETNRDSWVKHCQEVATQAVQIMPVAEAIEVFIAELKKHSHTKTHSAISFAERYRHEITSRAGFLGWVDGTC